jgi:hypothetical protein
VSKTRRPDQHTAMENAQRLYDQLIGLDPPEEVSVAIALKRIGMLVDIAGDLGREEGTTLALDWANALSKSKLRSQQRSLLEYFVANAWHNRRRLRHQDPAIAWQWEQPELLQEIYHLRAAGQSKGFDKLAAGRRCQILTNLGNQLSAVGRFVEARNMWSRALAANPRFGMALGNRGAGLVTYARSHYDSRQQAVLLYFAHADLSAALAPTARYHGEGQQAAKAYFAAQKLEIENAIHVDRIRRALKLDAYDLGKSAGERSYRRWALREGLFLDPLNDLGPHAIAARDMLSLPSYTTSIGEPPTLIGFFNQMKQEFVSARWLLYEGLHAKSVHFSDRHVALYNTLDYPAYGLAIEKVKAAYRIAYSLFDKVAFFLNDYAKLGVDPRQVYFRTIWYENPRDTKSGIRAAFDQSRNLPLRGLFWLAKDLFDPALREAMEPEAKALYAIRNHLEHSYLKIHDIMPPKSQAMDQDAAWSDRLAYSVQRGVFENKALHVLRLARAALIYLCFGMHREELRRESGKAPGVKVPMALPLMEMRWKL